MMFGPVLWQHCLVARHQTHRSLALKDERLFAKHQLPALRAAATDVCRLLDSGYAARSPLGLVGHQHNRWTK
jgi:hypothetical protein